MIKVLTMKAKGSRRRGECMFEGDKRCYVLMERKVIKCVPIILCVKVKPNGTKICLVFLPFFIISHFLFFTRIKKYNNYDIKNINYNFFYKIIRKEKE